MACRHARRGRPLTARLRRWEHYHNTGGEPWQRSALIQASYGSWWNSHNRWKQAEVGLSPLVKRSEGRVEYCLRDALGRFLQMPEHPAVGLSTRYGFCRS